MAVIHVMGPLLGIDLTFRNLYPLRLPAILLWKKRKKRKKPKKHKKLQKMQKKLALQKSQMLKKKKNFNISPLED